MAEGKLTINGMPVRHLYGNISGVLKAAPGAIMIAETPIEDTNKIRKDIFIQGKHIAGGYGVDTKEDLFKIQEQLNAYIRPEIYTGINKTNQYYYQLKGDTYSVFYIDKDGNKTQLSDIDSSDSKIYIIDGNFYTFDGININKISSGSGGSSYFKPYDTLTDETLRNMYEVGGMSTGEFTIAELKQKTISEILCEILFPMINPTVTLPYGTQKSTKTLYWGETLKELDANDLFNINNGSISLPNNNSSGWKTIDVTINTKQYKDNLGNRYRIGDKINKQINKISIEGTISYSNGTYIYNNYGQIIQYPYENYLSTDNKLISGSTKLSYDCNVLIPILPEITERPSISSLLNNGWYIAGTKFSYIDGIENSNIIDSIIYNYGKISLNNVVKSDMHFGGISEKQIDSKWKLNGTEYNSEYIGGSNGTTVANRSYTRGYSVTTLVGTRIYAMGNDLIYIDKGDGLLFNVFYQRLCDELNSSSYLKTLIINNTLTVNAYFPFYFYQYTNPEDDNSLKWTYLGESKGNSTASIETLIRSSNTASDDVKLHRPQIAVPVGKKVTFQLFNSISNNYELDKNVGWDTNGDIWYSFAEVNPQNLNVCPLTKTKPSGVEGKDYVKYNVYRRNETSSITGTIKFKFIIS